MGGGIKRIVMGGDINRCEIQNLHSPQQVEETEESRGVMLPVADDGVSGEGGVAGATPEARKQKKFSNKSRLFVGNLPRDFSGEELKKLFEEFGEVQEVYLQKEKNYGFVRLVRRCHNAKCTRIRELYCSAMEMILFSFFFSSLPHMIYEILLELLFTCLLYLPLPPHRTPPTAHTHTHRLIVVKQRRP